jgi:predicted hydrocarbon binding protein
MCAEHNDSKSPQIFGITFLGFFNYIKKHFGQEGVERVLTEIPDPYHNIFQRRIISVATYPYESFSSFLSAVDKILGSGDSSLLRQMGNYVAEKDMESVFMQGQRKAQIQDIVRDSGVFWNSYYINMGRMEPVEAEAEHIVMRIYDFPEMHKAHCHWLKGYIEGMITYCGVKSVRVREVKCTSDGDPYHEFDCTWNLS